MWRLQIGWPCNGIRSPSPTSIVGPRDFPPIRRSRHSGTGVPCNASEPLPLRHISAFLLRVSRYRYLIFNRISFLSLSYSYHS